MNFWGENSLGKEDTETFHPLPFLTPTMQGEKKQEIWNRVYNVFHLWTLSSKSI